jgi:hypothetical protein
MRTLLALVLSALLPARGKHRALTVPTPSATPRPVPASRAEAVIDTDGLPMVRPYLIHREQQRRRRHMAAPTAIGQDMRMSA